MANYYRRAGFTIVELLVVIAIIGILMAILLPAVQSAREAARRTSCKNNLRQIGYATNLYHDTNGHLPPPAAGNGSQYEDFGSVFVILLPFLEQGSLYATYEPTELIGHPVNLAITTQPVATYLCPSAEPPADSGEDGQPFAAGNYLASTRTGYFVSDYDGAFDNVARDKRYTLSYKNITDGLTKTVFVGEINHSFNQVLPTTTTNGPTNFGAGFAWAPGYWFVAFGHMALDSYDPDTGFLGTAVTFNNHDTYLHPFSARTFRSSHPGGVHFVMLDSSVQWVGDDSDPSFRGAIVTRAGEEIFSGDEVVAR